MSPDKWSRNINLEPHERHASDNVKLKVLMENKAMS